RFVRDWSSDVCSSDLCATGEEAYSLAILVKEHLLEVKKDIEVKIFASDIDKDALAKAAKGCYPDSIRKDVSEKRLNNFFTKVGRSEERRVGNGRSRQK